MEKWKQKLSEIKKEMTEVEPPHIEHSFSPLSNSEESIQNDEQAIKKQALEFYFLKSALEKQMGDLKVQLNAYKGIPQAEPVILETEKLIREIEQRFSTTISGVRNKLRLMTIGGLPAEQIQPSDVFHFRSNISDVLDMNMRGAIHANSVKNAIHGDMEFVTRIVESKSLGADQSLKVDVPLDRKDLSAELKSLIQTNGHLMRFSLSGKWRDVMEKMDALEMISLANEKQKNDKPLIKDYLEDLRLTLGQMPNHINDLHETIMPGEFGKFDSRKMLDRVNAMEKELTELEGKTENLNLRDVEQTSYKLRLEMSHFSSDISRFLNTLSYAREINSSLAKKLSDAMEWIDQSKNRIGEIKKDKRTDSIFAFSIYEKELDNRKVELEKWLAISKSVVDQKYEDINEWRNQLSEGIGTLRQGLKFFDSDKVLPTRMRELENRYEAQKQLWDNPPNKIEKRSDSAFDSRDFYSIWCDYKLHNSLQSTPLLMFEGNEVLHLFSTRQDEPLKIKKIPLPRFIKDHLEELHLKKGDFCDRFGRRLLDESVKFSADIFHQVQTGIEILPKPKANQGYVIKAPQKVDDSQSEAESLKPRHWGQVYLAGLRPDSVLVGQILGSGGSYKAYVFGDKTLVEFDYEKHGTYLFETHFFSQLKSWNRESLLRDRPKGLHGRLIHSDTNRESWRGRVNGFLGLNDSQKIAS